MKSWVLGVTCLLGLTIAFVGFSNHSKELKAKEAAAVKVVQDSKGLLDNVSTLEGIATILGASEATGSYVKVDGWSCSYHSTDKSYDVWFEVNENDKHHKFHWVIDAEKNLHPANDMAQMVTRLQQVTM